MHKPNHSSSQGELYTRWPAEAGWLNRPEGWYATWCPIHLAMNGEPNLGMQPVDQEMAQSNHVETQNLLDYPMLPSLDRQATCLSMA